MPPLPLYLSEKPYPNFTPIFTPIPHFYPNKNTGHQINQDKQKTAVFSAKINPSRPSQTNPDNSCRREAHSKRYTVASPL